MFGITLTYAAILSLIFVGLSLRVVAGRFKTKTSFGDGGDADLNVRIRTHSNFAEYIPLALILLMGVETYEYPRLVIHIFGTLLILSRLSHAYGLSKNNGLNPARPAGMITTFLVMAVSAIMILIKAML